MNDKYTELGYEIIEWEDCSVELSFKERRVVWWCHKPTVYEINKVCYNDLNKLNGGEK